MVKVLSAKDPWADSMTEKESKNFLENKVLLIHIGAVDEEHHL
jgi:hypothetical protein